MGKRIVTALLVFEMFLLFSFSIYSPTIKQNVKVQTYQRVHLVYFEAESKIDEVKNETVSNTIDGIATAYCECAKCNGKKNVGITKTGKKLTNGMIACNWLNIGTKVLIDGKMYVVADIGSSRFNKVGRIDIFISGHKNALEFGKQNIKIEILKDGD